MAPRPRVITKKYLKSAIKFGKENAKPRVSVRSSTSPTFTKLGLPSQEMPLQIVSLKQFGIEEVPEPSETKV